MRPRSSPSERSVTIGVTSAWTSPISGVECHIILASFRSCIAGPEPILHPLCSAVAVRMSDGMERMAENGTATFASPDDYQAGIGRVSSKGASVNFIVTGGGDFKARLTWLNLLCLRVLRGSENLPSIAYVSLPPERVVVLFPTSAATLIWGGLELRLGDIVLHGRGERMHQRTPGEGNWGLISLPPEQLSACALSLTGSKIVAPSFRRVLRPPRRASSRLLRLHSKACRLAETRRELIANSASRAIGRAGIAACAGQLPDGRGYRRWSSAAASY